MVIDIGLLKRLLFLLQYGKRYDFMRCCKCVCYDKGMCLDTDKIVDCDGYCKDFKTMI